MATTFMVRRAFSMATPIAVEARPAPRLSTGAWRAAKVLYVRPAALADAHDREVHFLHGQLPGLDVQSRHAWIIAR